jgi:hypothetical protein
MEQLKLEHGSPVEMLLKLFSFIIQMVVGKTITLEKHQEIEFKNRKLLYHVQHHKLKILMETYLI